MFPAGDETDEKTLDRKGDGLMDQNVKKRLILAAVLIVLGLVAIGWVMESSGWEMAKLNTVEYETVSYPVEDAFRHITVETETADVRLLPSADGTCKVVCFKDRNVQYTVSVDEGKLSIRSEDQRKWHEKIGVMTEKPSVAVYMPAGVYGDLFVQSSTGHVEIPGDFSFDAMEITTSTGDVQNNASAAGEMHIRTSTGDIKAEHVSAAAMELTVSTGKIDVLDVTCIGNVSVYVSTGRATLTDVVCRNLLSVGGTGSMVLNHVAAEETFSLERSTGRVTFENCDAGEIYVTTSTGDVQGSLLSGKQFVTRTDTGSVQVPDSTFGGRCEIVTDTGDIRISIAD